MTTGEKIALQRRKAGFSQEALAGQLGISRQAISRWETNESLPDTEKIIRLSRLFGVSTDYLLLDDTEDGSLSPASRAGSASAPPRWFRPLGILLARGGILLALLGLAGAILWAFQTDQWYTDFGRFGTALFFKWPGSILLGGLIALLLALLLLIFDILLTKKTVLILKRKKVYYG